MGIQVIAHIFATKKAKLTFGLIGHEEHGFSTTIGSNILCQELVPTYVKNPCSFFKKI